MFIPARKNKGKIWTDVKILFLTSSFLHYFSFFPFPLPLISSLQILIALLISKLCSLNNVLTPLFLNIIGDVSKVPMKMFKPDKMPALRGESGNKGPPLAKKLFRIDTRKKKKEEESVFSYGMSLGISTLSQDRSPAQE